jgi:hypothetical protein
MPVGAVGTARRYSATAVDELAALFASGVAANAAKVDTANIAPTNRNILIMI